MALHISISAEPIFEVAGFAITNSLFTGAIVTFFLLLFAFSFQLQPSLKSSKPTKRLQIFIEMIIEALYNLTVDIAGHKKARVFFPFIITSFLFILLNNWAGLFPGVGTIGFTHTAAEESIKEESYQAATIEPAYAAADAHPEPLEVTETDTHDTVTPESEIVEESHPESDKSEEHAVDGESHSTFVPLFRAATADLNTTIALALLSVILTQIYGVKYLGLSYFKKFFNFSSPIFTFVGLLEIISEFAKIISFAFRLFGNIFAGEVLLVVIASIIPIIAPIPFFGLEIFVGMIQALVFAMLSLVFMNIATQSHDH